MFVDIAAAKEVLSDPGKFFHPFYAVSTSLKPKEFETLFLVVFLFYTG